MKAKEFWSKGLSKTAVLSPVDRISEVLFGLIMVLTFTGAISVSSDGKEEISELLWAALGCNVAWGIVDAIMYLMNVLFDRGYSRNILMNIRKSKDDGEANKLLRDYMHPIFSDLFTDEEVTLLNKKISTLPEPPPGVFITGRDLLSTLQIFFLVFLCTLPVALPFGFIDDPGFALRVSNGIALLMLFIGGFQLARYAGFHPFLTAIIYMLIGLALVSATIALGG